MNHEDAVSQALEDNGNSLIVGYKLRSWSFLDVRLKGTARGFIAIGPKARGVIAIGGIAMGVIACGGLAMGLFSIGGLAIGLIAAGGMGFGGFAYGGIAIGLMAFGGMSIGIISVGGMAIGLWVPSGAECIQYFNSQTVPRYLRFLDNAFRSSQNSSAVPNGIAICTLIFWLPFIPLMLLQGIAMAREYKRIKKINPADVY